MDRKSFLIKTGTALIIGIPLASLWNCGGSDDATPGGINPPNGTADCGTNGTNSAIGTNHGHSLAVSASDVNAGIAKTYDIRGSASHDHQVTVSAGDFAKLQDNQSISVVSSSNGHSHSVNISCA